MKRTSVVLAGTFGQIAEAIESQQRRALIELAFIELEWHCPGEAVSYRAEPPSGDCSRHAA